MSERIKELEAEIEELKRKQQKAKTQQEYEDYEIAICDNYGLIESLRE